MENIKSTPQLKLSLICSKLPKIEEDNQMTWQRIHVLVINPYYENMKDTWCAICGLHMKFCPCMEREKRFAEEDKLKDKSDEPEI